MAKGETKKTNKMLESQLATQNKNFGEFNKTQMQRSGEAYGRSNELYDKMLAGYGDMAAGNTLAGAGGGGFGGGWALPAGYGQAKKIYEEFGRTGGIDAEKIRGAGHSTMEEISKSGGFDDATKARILGDINAYRTMGQTGGVDAAAQERMRGAGVFDEFARTGGISEADARNIRARGAAPLSAMYGGMTDEMNRARRIRGGSSAMGNAAALRMARERSKSMADAALETEMGLSDRIRSGRQWGGENIAGSEAGLQNLLSSNRLAGMGGALGGEMGLADTVAKNRLTGAGMWNQSETGIQGMIQSGRLSGAQGIESIAGAEASHAASNASAGAADARFREGLRSEGLEGLFALRGQNPGEVANYDRNVLAGIGGQAGAANEALGMRYNAPGNNTSGWDKFGNIVGGAAGIAGGLLTGGATTALKGAGAAGAGQIVNPELMKRLRF